MKIVNTSQVHIYYIYTRTCIAVRTDGTLPKSTYTIFTQELALQYALMQKALGWAHINLRKNLLRNMHRWKTL
jgi:hypothetical protein